MHSIIPCTYIWSHSNTPYSPRLCNLSVQNWLLLSLKTEKRYHLELCSFYFLRVKHSRKGLAMSTAIDPAITSLLGSQPGFTSANTLYPPILATVIICSILITVFTSARLITKRLVSTYDVEDCEFKTNRSTICMYSNIKDRPDFLICAWVGIH